MADDNARASETATTPPRRRRRTNGTHTPSPQVKGGISRRRRRRPRRPTRARSEALAPRCASRLSRGRRRTSHTLLHDGHTPLARRSGRKPRATTDNARDPPPSLATHLAGRTHAHHALSTRRRATRAPHRRPPPRALAKTYLVDHLGARVRRGRGHVDRPADDAHDRVAARQKPGDREAARRALVRA